MNKSKIIGWLSVTAGVVCILSMMLITEFVINNQTKGVRYLPAVIGVSLLAYGFIVLKIR